MLRLAVKVFVGSLLVAACVATAAAQSLGEVARKEQERRQTVTPGKVYTNKDIKGQPPPSSQTQPDAADAKDAAKPVRSRAASTGSPPSSSTATTRRSAP
jgi:hypothetical protein